MSLTEGNTCESNLFERKKFARRKIQNPLLVKYNEMGLSELITLQELYQSYFATLNLLSLLT